MKKRLLIALLAGGAVFATVFGVAASLTVNSDTLGAGSDAVASCDDNVDVSYTVAWDDTDKRFEVTQVKVSNIDQGCSGQELTVQLTGSGGAALSGATGSTPIGGTSATVNIGTPPAASAVEDVHVVITG
jgi:hypothetical protein